MQYCTPVKGKLRAGSCDYPSLEKTTFSHSSDLHHLPADRGVCIYVLISWRTGYGRETRRGLKLSKRLEILGNLSTDSLSLPVQLPSPYPSLKHSAQQNPITLESWLYCIKIGLIFTLGFEQFDPFT